MTLASYEKLADWLADAVDGSTETMSVVESTAPSSGASCATSEPPSMSSISESSPAPSSSAPSSSALVSSLTSTSSPIPMSSVTVSKTSSGNPHKVPVCGVEFALGFLGSTKVDMVGKRRAQNRSTPRNRSTADSHLTVFVFAGRTA